jgi:hypothetical protein
MIDTRENTRQGVCTQGWGTLGPRDMTIDGCMGLDGRTGSMEGHDESFECGFMKGRDTPKRHDVSHK